jgi:hypothetical protein
MGLNIEWTAEDYRVAQEELSSGRYRTVVEACTGISARFGRNVSRNALGERLKVAGLLSPGHYFRAAGSGQAAPVAEAQPAVMPEPDEPARFRELVAVLKRGPLQFSELCDALNMAPGRTRALVTRAKEAGVQVHVENDHVGIRGVVADSAIVPVGVAPVVGQVQRVAVISDTHLGSKYCLRDQLRDFVNHAYDSGVRDVLHVGDVLDGCYRHGVFELTHTGIDAQCQDLFEVLPERPGMRYHAITGNHDQTFEEKTGMSVGAHIAGYFRDRGRNDLTFYGDRSAFLKIHGAVIHLWHPRVSPAYATSYQIQKEIERYSSIKPGALLVGHWHRFCEIYQRGVHGIACPTFQGGQSSFGKSLGGSPAIGGLILSWQVTEHGTIRDFSTQRRFYFEREEPIQIHNPLDADAIRPHVAQQSARWER